MKYLLTLGFAFLVCGPINAQPSARRENAEIVKEIIGTIAARDGSRVQIITHDLLARAGRIDGVYPDHFVLSPKERKPLINIRIGRRPQQKGFSIRYSDVLQLEANEMTLSFVPDPDSDKFGSWQDLETLRVGTFLQVVHPDGKKTHGLFLKAEGDIMIVVRGNTQHKITSAEADRVYRVAGDSSNLTRKLLKGVGKGAKVTDEILPIGDPSARANPVASGIGAAIGALIFILPQRSPTRVLVYAR